MDFNEIISHNLSLPAAQIADRHVAPTDPHGKTGAKRLGTGFLRGPAFGQCSRLILATTGFGQFGFGKDTIAETVAKPVQRPLNPVDIRKICADAKDHSPLTSARTSPVC